MKTRLEYDYAYNGLSTAEFGKRTGQSAAQVRELIASGWFDWMHEGKPGVLDIAGPGAGQPRYKIHPVAVERFYNERKAPRPYPPRRKSESAA